MEFADNPGWFYVSTPMTTGKRYLDHIRKNGLGGKTTNILEANIARSKEVTESVKLLHPGCSIINPTQWTYEGYESNDYLAFWVMVISRYCSKIFFVDDWEYSSGCAYEFLVAQKCMHRTDGKPPITCYDERGNALTLKDGIRLIKSAIKASKPSVSTDFLEKVLIDLSNLERAPYEFGWSVARNGVTRENRA